MRMRKTYSTTSKAPTGSGGATALRESMSQRALIILLNTLKRFGKMAKKYNLKEDLERLVPYLVLIGTGVAIFYLIDLCASLM